MTRVLNVNDREVPRYVSEQMLVRGGYEVTSAANGQAALAEAATGAYEIVLLDVQLPDLDGFEICHRLKHDAATENLIVLMTSATFVNPKNKVLGLDSGADGYLVQPYEAAELYATLRSLQRVRAAEKRASALAEQLQAALEVRDDFLAMLGHELRNPLSAITTALELMHTQHTAGDEKYRNIVARQTQNLTRIVDDLLDVARITRGKIILHREHVDLRDVARRCAASHEAEVAHAGHQLVLALGDAPAVVLGDAVRLEQIASNLVTNAIKYTPRGGHIRVAVGRDDAAQRARFEVTDDGVGMSEAMRARAFDLFVQGKQTIERARGGLGLGLTVVKQLVELHGGTVGAHANPDGKGTRLVVELPLADQAHAAEPRLPTQPHPAARGLDIVVIEDNDDARETLTEALGLLDHRVRSAATGAAGLELVLGRPPDVVLMDIGLPELDGYELARRIHVQLDGRAPRLVAMTGYGQPDDRERAAQAGFDSHLVKPVSLEKLAGVLARLARPR